MSGFYICLRQHLRHFPSLPILVIPVQEVGSANNSRQEVTDSDKHIVKTELSVDFTPEEWPSIWNTHPDLPSPLIYFMNLQKLILRIALLNVAPSELTGNYSSLASSLTSQLPWNRPSLGHGRGQHFVPSPPQRQ